jgi:hypothetical protein
MVTPKKVMQEILSEMLPEGWTDRVMGRMIEMDDLMDEKGYLRFCTREQTMRLMGNAISDEVAQIAQKSGLTVNPANTGKKSRGLMNRLAQVKWIRFILQGTVNRIYRWLNN